MIYKKLTFYFTSVSDLFGSTFQHNVHDPKLNTQTKLCSWATEWTITNLSLKRTHSSMWILVSFNDLLKKRRIQRLFLLQAGERQCCKIEKKQQNMQQEKNPNVDGYQRIHHVSCCSFSWWALSLLHKLILANLDIAFLIPSFCSQSKASTEV